MQNHTGGHYKQIVPMSSHQRGARTRSDSRHIKRDEQFEVGSGVFSGLVTRGDRTKPPDVSQEFI